MSDTPQEPRGQGEVLTDPHRLRSDINMVRRAVREGWGVPVEKRPVIVERLVGIVEKKGVTIMGEDGPVIVESQADSNAIAASRVLVAMDSSDQTDYWNADKNSRLDEGKATESIALDPVILRQPVRPV